MGESSDGSTAAQGAPDPSEAGDGVSQRGFFGRILDALSGADADMAEAAEVQRRSAAPGLGALRRLRVDEVAVAKQELVAVPDTATLDELVAVFREHGFSRLPVYKERLDAPVGLIHLKDLALKHGFGAAAPFELQPLLRPLLYVPPSMHLVALLQKMQAERIHMALVIDEYGGVDGLITIEDIVEQVVGEIDDEHDEAEARLWLKEKPGQWLVQARAPLDEFEEAVGRRLSGGEEDEEVDTMGGLVFLLTGRVPSRGEVIRAESGVEFEVVDADPRSIKRLRVRLPEAAA